MSATQGADFKRDVAALQKAVPLDMFMMGARRWVLQIRVRRINVDTTSDAKTKTVADAKDKDKDKALVVQLAVQQEGVSETVCSCRVCEREGKSMSCGSLVERLGW